MPHFTAKRRRLSIPQVDDLFAVPITSLFRRRFRQVAFFHPQYNYFGFQNRATSIVDSDTATKARLKRGQEVVINLYDVSTKQYHDVKIVIGEIVSGYKDFQHPGNGLILPPRPFLWVSADELAPEVDFSDPNPLMSVKQISLKAHKPAKCYT